MKLIRETIFSKGTFVYTWNAQTANISVQNIVCQLPLTSQFTEIVNWLKGTSGYAWYRCDVGAFFSVVLGENVSIEAVDPKLLSSKPAAAYNVISGLDLDGAIFVTSRDELLFRCYCILDKTTVPVAGNTTTYELHLTLSIKYLIP